MTIPSSSSITSISLQDLTQHRDGSRSPAPPCGRSTARLPGMPGLSLRVQRQPEGAPPLRRQVAVSNRLVDPAQPAAGGLAAALGGLMKATRGLWLGWSGKINDAPDAGPLPMQRHGRTTLVPVDLSQAEHDHYYAGFANKVLWPVFHGLGQHAESDAQAIDRFFQGYEQVNRRFAAALAPLLQEDDIVWVHDYHLIPMAAELRRQGCRQRMGFFNHTRFPTEEELVQIPQHQQLVRALFDYDVIGMQVRRDVERLHEYVEIRAEGRQPDPRHMQAFGKTVRTQHFPIGIDVAEFTSQHVEADAGGVLARVRRERRKRIVITAADRMDYTKGMPERLAAFRLLLERHPECRRHVTLAQIASPSRESVAEYAAARDEVRDMVAALNKDYGSHGWTPVLHFEQVVDRRAIPEFFRLGRVGAVTPVADGMNLVAKEYVAAQDPELPGTLVLSQAAGAAVQLARALMVDPRDPAGMAEVFYRALLMPLEERRERHAALLENVQQEDLQWWSNRFLDALEGRDLPLPVDMPAA